MKKPDIFGGVYDGESSDDQLTSDPLDMDTGFTRPRMAAEQTKIGRDADTGQFTAPDMGGDPVPVERDQETGQFGADPYAVGNFGAFNSPYKTIDEDR